MAVHQRHLELVLEVGQGAHASDHDLRVLTAQEVDQQPRKGLDPDVGPAGQNLAQDLQPFFVLERAGLLDV